MLEEDAVKRLLIENTPTKLAIKVFRLKREVQRLTESTENKKKENDKLVKSIKNLKRKLAIEKNKNSTTNI